MTSEMILELQDSITEKDRAVILRFLNRAYKELYDTYDLPNSVVDEYFEIDGTDGQIVLPEYVDQIRGAGSRMDYVPITISDFRSGYRVTPNFQQPYEWRLRGETPLSSQMDATDRITVTLLAEETETVNVTIVGQTAASSTYTETVTLIPGETTITTESQFVADNPYALTSVLKDIPTINDVVLTVASTGTEISRIRNRLLRARYQLFQLTDVNPATGGAWFNYPPGAQIVYKKAFYPLLLNTDEIIYPKAESCVCWKARELWFNQKTDESSFAACEQANKKVTELINNLMMNQESAAEMKVNFGRNPYNRAWVWNRRRGGLGIGYGYTR